jgi:hypothetical protein
VRFAWGHEVNGAKCAASRVEGREAECQRATAGNLRIAGRLAGLKMGIYPSPLFFVSVAAKGVNFAVSLLFATLAKRSISVAAKGLRLRLSG